MMGVDPFIAQQLYERWFKIEGRKDSVSDELQEFFGEVGKLGYNKKAIRAAFRIKRAYDAMPSEIFAESEEVAALLVALGLTADTASRVARNAPTRESVPPEPPISPIKARVRAIMASGEAA